MIFAPVQLLVNLVTVLPDPVRPGAFIVLVVAMGWFVFVQRGLPNLWHAICRLTARILDVVVGLALLPDYLVTTARQRQGRRPGQATQAVGGVAERFLDGADGLYRRHQRAPIEWKPFPWKPAVAIFALATVPWIVMSVTPATSPVRQELAAAYDFWRDVEGWADVNPSRRAAPGVSWPTRPRLLDYRRRGRVVSAIVHCAGESRCEGRLIARDGRGRRLNTRLVTVRSGATKTARMRLSRMDAGSNYVFVRIARANPG